MYLRKEYNVFECTDKRAKLIGSHIILITSVKFDTKCFKHYFSVKIY